MANPLQYTFTPLPVKEYDYDPWVTSSMKRKMKRAEEARRKEELQRKHIRSVFKSLVEKYDAEMLDEIWKKEFTPRDLIAEFEDRQYL